jgi:hypothetical protein
MKTAGTALVLFALTAAANTTLAASDAADSIYTDISESSCEPIPAANEPIDEDGLRCKGPAGYQLLALSGDLRASVTLVAPDGKELPLQFWEVITGHFSYLGPRAEWRVHEPKGAPYAVIVRMFAYENPEDPRRTTSYLAVAKINPDATCVTDRIDAGADDNERARAAADSAASRPCLAPPEPQP